MASVIEQVEADIVTALQTISYFDPTMTPSPGTVRGVSDIATFLDITTVAPPAAIIVFDGEKAKPNEVIGYSLQETMFHWTIYLISAGFGGDNENRAQAYQMIDDTVDALEGVIVSTDPAAKLFYVGASRDRVLPEAVVYQSRWRHAFTRSGA